VGVVDARIAEPMRHLNLGVRQIVELHGIVVATLDPLCDAHVVVELESIHVANPHDASRMVSPALDRLTTLQLERRVDKLHGFDTLLTQAAIIEAGDRKGKRRIRQESLHDV